ncbi:MAG: RNA 2',3'-cyclic phosphodiesterase [Bryobacteraceae bacterium]
MRLFTAIDLPEEMLDQFRDFLVRLRPLAKLRWSPVENLHITTKFIGEWPESRIEEMKTALGSVNSQPIEISVGGLGWFPDVHRPRVFWAGVHAGRPLTMLAHSTEQAVARLYVPVEKRQFSPHLTLARMQAAVPLDDLRKPMGDPDFGTFIAFSFFLYLSSNGRYSKLAEFPLNS